MWVISSKVLHIQNPYTNERLDFSREMVDKEIPQECEANSFFAAYLRTEEKPDNPLTQLHDDQAAVDTLEKYISEREGEVEKIKAEKNRLIAMGGLDALDGRQIVVPILPNFRRTKKEPAERPAPKKPAGSKGKKPQ
jgi:hypothetical protein